MRGAIVGTATFLSAVATIGAFLGLHGHGHGHGQSPAVVVAGSTVNRSSAVRSSGPSSSAGPTFRRLWGPAPFNVTNDGSTVGSVPPQSDAPGDLYYGDPVIAPMNGAQIAIWHGAKPPTPAQCLNAAQTQSGVQVKAIPGTRLCVLSSSGPLAIVTLTGVDPDSAVVHTTTSIWAQN